MATDAETLSPAGLARRRTGVLLPRWPAAAWASIAVTLAFVGVTCWWLSQDRSIPIDDAASHLNSAIDTYEALISGRVLRALTTSSPYPPLTFLVGALGTFVGGVEVAPPIIAQNVVFVLLLALGCYKVGRLAFGPSAGLLAVVFALGSPMTIEEFHEFMLDAPEAAMVATAVWAILATRCFSRLGVSALAGLAVGLGMLSKETFVFFVAGVTLVSAVRGGRGAWRGVAIFTAVALVIALPWYLYEFSTVRGLGSQAFASSSYSLHVFPGIAPPRLSRANLEWYFWSVVNWQLYLPLFVFSAVGWVWTLVGFARRRPVSALAAELAVGAFVSWLALTETYLHDARYAVPMAIYFAVFAAGWISRLPRLPRALAATALVLVALANSLGVSLGVGSPVASAPLNITYEQQPGRFTLYSNYGLWVGPPQRDGEMLRLLRALRQAGVRAVWVSESEGETEFSYPGMLALARVAGVRIPPKRADPVTASRHEAFLSRAEPDPNLPIPCIRLASGAGIWVRIGGARGPAAWGYCPLRLG